MNDIQPGSAQNYRIFSRPNKSSGQEPLGTQPEEREPITNPVTAVEAILRQPRRVMYRLQQPDPGPLILAMVLVVVISSMVYGIVVGTFSNGMQLWAAPAKIAGG